MQIDSEFQVGHQSGSAIEPFSLKAQNLGFYLGYFVNFLGESPVFRKWVYVSGLFCFRRLINTGGQN